MGKNLPSHHRVREEGEAYLSRLRRTVSRRISNAVGGHSPASKRNMSGILMGAAAVLFGLDVAPDFGPEWLDKPAFALLLIAWFVARNAGEQEREESSARDLVEWGREAQAFRRAVGPLWGRLRGAPYNTFADVIGCQESFDDLVAKAGWPDAPGDTTDKLAAYLRECLPPSYGHDTIIPPQRIGSMRLQLGFMGDKPELITEWEKVKDILEIWSIALNVGGSRAPTLRRVIRGLRQNHLNSIRLMWFLSIAHTAHVNVTDNPDYAFVERIRDVMQSRL